MRSLKISDNLIVDMAGIPGSCLFDRSSKRDKIQNACVFKPERKENLPDYICTFPWHTTYIFKQGHICLGLAYTYTHNNFCTYGVVFQVFTHM